jgi:hypothetical protein
MLAVHIMITVVDIFMIRLTVVTMVILYLLYHPTIYILDTAIITIMIMLWIYIDMDIHILMVTFVGDGLNLLAFCF